VVSAVDAVAVSDRLLRAREVAELLGLSPATVLDWFESGRLPGFKLSSRAVRFRESELLAWLEDRRVAPRDALGVSCDRPDRVA
jgi:excisionase family DNA binding protein